MTEEIIIDGVNVAGCEHYCEKLNTGSGFIQNTSKQGFCLHNITGLQNADIYFRVLSFPKCREQSNCHYKQLKRLEQENKELKEKIKDKPLQCIFYNDKQNKCALFTKTVAYRCALKEIREKIKSLNKDICNNCGWYNTDNCPPNGYVCNDLIEIKDKINEVLK